MAITLVENDLPAKSISDTTGLDIELIEKLESLYDNRIDTQGKSTVTLEEKYEIAKYLLNLDFLQMETIAKKTNLTVEEVDALRKINS